MQFVQPRFNFVPRSSAAKGKRKTERDLGTRLASFSRCLFFPSPVESEGGAKKKKDLRNTYLYYLLSHTQYELQCNDKLGSPSKYMYVKYCQVRENAGK